MNEGRKKIAWIDFFPLPWKERMRISARRKIEKCAGRGCRYSKHPATIYNGLHVELWPFKGPVPWRNRPLNYGLFERDGYLNRRLLARRRPPQILQQAARSVSQIPFRESHEKARVPRGRERGRGRGETGPSSFENRVVHDFIPLVSDRFTSVILCKNLDLDETRRDESFFFEF